MSEVPWHVCVLVPARNEEELLPRCLQSVLGACSKLPAGATYDVVVTVDRSDDRTFAIAQSLLGELGHVVTTDAGVVGLARALAATTALQRFSGPLDRCWLANTDADCCVPEAWLIDQLDLAKAAPKRLPVRWKWILFQTSDPALPLSSKRAISFTLTIHTRTCMVQT